MLPQTDIARAKTAPILTVLAEFGHRPTKKVGAEWYFLSPLREERTPSFCVKEDENSWFDHGLAAGGDVLELVLQLADTTFADGVKFLLPYAGAAAPAELQRQLQTVPTSSASSIVNLRRQPLKDPGLLRYLLADRGLNVPVILDHSKLGRWLGEAVYERAGKTSSFRSVCWLNDAGGYTLKGPYRPDKGFTAVHGPSCYTRIPAAKPNARQLAVYEGVFDYLSALVLTEQAEFDDIDVLVLNSTTNTRQALALIDHYDAVDLCLDNDGGGDRCTAAWLAACAGKVDVVDQRTQWAGFKDLNDLLCQRPKSDKPKVPAPARHAAPSAATAKAAGYGRWWLWIKWNTPRADPGGKLWETMTYYSEDDQYPSRDRLKAILKKNLAAGTVAVARLCTKDDTGKMKILEQWPKPKF